MMTFPVATPLIATAVPLTTRISFDVPGGMLVVGILLAVVIVGVGAAPSIARSWRFVVRWVRNPHVALPNMGTQGAHR